MAYYAVLIGKNIGVYDNIEDCHKQIKGVTKSKFKRLKSTTMQSALKEFQALLMFHDRKKDNKDNAFYGVVRGHQTGLYDNWSDANKQLLGFTYGKCNKFFALNEKDALKIFKEMMDAENQRKEQKKKTVAKIKSESIEKQVEQPTEFPQENVMVVNGFSENQKNCSYRGLFINSKKIAFKSKVFDSGSNNIAEYLAIYEGIKYILENNINPKTIYTTSLTALSWIKNKKINTTMQLNKDLLIEVESAEKFFKEKEDLIKKINILKWNTKLWGKLY